MIKPLFNLCIYYGIFTLFLFEYASCYFVTIPANTDNCYFDRIKANTDLLLIYEVAEGGSLDIDAKLYDPNGQEIYTGDRKSDDRFSFKSSKDGIYKYCFGNKMTSQSNKILMFSLETVTTPKASQESHTKLEGMVMELDKVLNTVKHEQEYMETRDRTHKRINDNTNSRVVLWALFEACVLLVMTAGQVYYLKRFFEVRRVV